MVVLKGAKVMQLLKNGQVVRSYRVALGRNSAGPKRKAGDCRTPEGIYLIDRRNGKSAFHKSLHISYPNSADAATAHSEGHSPGGNIAIHGLPRGFDDLEDIHYRKNWTKGCIAVNNREIDEIWQLVPDGTPVEIRP
ncbi:hypothetical protein GMSM_27620 [Geomonas sp. Red276]